MDDKIWSSAKGAYFIEEKDWVEGATTKLPRGTELTRYSDDTLQVIGTYVASATGKWISY